MQVETETATATRETNMIQNRIAINLGSVYGTNCPGCGKLSTVRPGRGGTFRAVERCSHFVGAVAKDGAVELVFDAKPCPLA